MFSLSSLIPGSKSKNTVKNLIDLTNNVVRDAVFACGASGSNTISRNYTSFNGNVSLRGNNMIQRLNIDADCINNTKFTDNLELDLQDQFKQQATSTAQMFQLTNSESENYTENSKKLATSLLTKIKTTCLPQLQNIIQENINASGNIEIENQTYDQSLTLISKCTATAVGESSYLAIMKTIIDQSAVAKTENTLAGILWIGGAIVIALLAMGAISIKGGVNLFDKKPFWLGVGGLIILWLAVAFLTERFPFDKKAKSTTSSNSDARP
jgi:hypothetical protein